MLRAYFLSKFVQMQNPMKKEDKNMVNEPSEVYLTNSPEAERLKKDVFRPDMEKLQLFTKMLRTNALLKKAIITHK